MEKILVIDDERPILDMLELSLGSEGYKVLTAENGKTGFELFEQERPRLVITDIKMPGIDGLEILRRIRESGQESEVIIITGHGDMDTAINACKYGASDFVTKPIRDDALMLALKRAEEKLNVAQKLRDYTKDLERAVEERTEELRRVQQEKLQNERLATIGETVTGLAHYIKNILNGLRGGLYKIDSGMKREELVLVREGRDMAQRNVEKISELVLDLLSYSVERKPQPKRCDPNDIARKVIESFDQTAEENDIHLAFIADSKLKDAYLDEGSVHRVLLNLVSNAIEACIYDQDRSKDFEVTSKVVLEKDEKGKDVILFEVIDNGCGMGEDVKGKIFTRFFTTKKERGTGLGLLIARKIAHEHGGSISVESEEGQGSTFRLRLKGHES